MQGGTATGIEAAAKERLGSCTVGCGACCKFLVLQVNPQYIEIADAKKWIELHGIHLYMKDGGCWARIAVTCGELTSDGKCGLYGTPDRPKTCDTWPQSQFDINLVDEVDGKKTCTYGFSPEV